jgi:hypothetical protein
MDATRYPLSWPSGWARASTRQHSKFAKKERRYYGDGNSGSYLTSKSLSVGDGLDRLTGELGRLGAQQIIISSNLKLRQDGLPMSQQAAMLNDPGIAVYFKLKGKPRVLACDKWWSAAENMAAIAGHIEAIRAVDRYGVGTLEQAFAGYAALPAQAASWFITLEFDAPPKSWDVVETRYLELVKKHHPDRGGNPETMAKINAARDTARKELVG